MPTNKKTKAPTRATATAAALIPPPHPGETLLEDFMRPLGLSAYAVAKAIGATPIGVSQIVRGQRSISPEMALRLGRYTGTSAEFWLNLQAGFDLRQARDARGAEIEARVQPLAMAA